MKNIVSLNVTSVLDRSFIKRAKLIFTPSVMKLRRRRIKSRIFLHKNNRDKSNIHFVVPEINPMA